MKPVLFLHGALGTAHQMVPLTANLEKDLECHSITFEGHGELGRSGRPFKIQTFADNVLDFMDGNGIEKADIFGYSMGGYVGLYLSKIAPERVGRIATLGTVLVWTPEGSSSEAALLNPDKIAEKVPAFAEMLSKSHPHGWREVVEKTRELLLRLGESPPLNAEDWSDMKHKVRLYVGDRDTTAGLDHTVEVYRQLSDAELGVLPATPHPIHKVDVNHLARSLVSYFE